MTLATSRGLRLFTLCVLYLVQGIPTGFVSITLAAFLAEQGYSAAEVAQFLAVSWIPWALKAGWAPMLDRYTHSRLGRRRPWLFVAQLGMLTCLGGLIALPGLEAGLVPIAAFVFVYNIFGALQDVTTDALAVDLLREDERGLASGAMWSAKIGGIAIGGAGMSTILAQAGWRPALALQLALVLLAVTIALLVREHEADARFGWPRLAQASAEGGQTLKDVLRTFVNRLRQPGMRVLALLALLATVPTRMMVTFGPVFMVQSVGWSGAGYARFAGGPALLGGVAGALVGGWLADRIGRRTMVRVAAVGIMITFFTVAATESWWSTTWIIVVCLLAGIFFDMALRMALQAIIMTTSRSAVAATQFTVFMVMVNMSNVVGSGVIVPLDAFFDAQMIFVCGGLLAAVPLVLLHRLPPTERLQAAASAGDEVPPTVSVAA